jgi:hypothetical protein
MGFFDFFRPKWRHSDVEVRAEAVKNLGADEVSILGRVAKEDGEARIRRIAVKRLEDPRLLREIAEKDTDDAIRQLAETKATEILIARAVADLDARVALDALSELDEPKELGEVARRASLPDVRKQALSRLTDQKSLAELVRKSDSAQVRTDALARITDTTILKDLALQDEHKATVIAAVARVSDRAALEEIATKARSKVARTAAREKLPAEAHAPSTKDGHGKQTATGAAETSHRKKPTKGAIRPEDKTKRARLLQLCVAAEAIAAGRHDWKEATGELAELGVQWADVGFHDDALERRFEAAQSKFETRREQDVQERAQAAAAKKARDNASRLAAAAASTSAPESAPEAAPVVEAPAPVPAVVDPAHRLNGLATEAEKLVAGPPRGVEGRWVELERRWQEELAAVTAEGDAGVAAAQLRWDAVKVEIDRRRAEDQTRREARKAEQRAELERLAVELEKRVSDEKAGMKAIETAIKSTPPAVLRDAPPTDELAPLRARVKTAHEALSVRLGELRDAEGWKRWANVPKLEELCKEAEALAEVVKDVEDKRRAPAVLKELNQRWKAAGPVPQEKSDILWARFKAATDLVYERCKEYFAKLDEDRAGNLTKKEALCVQAEALADSTEWKETSDKLKALQDEWKAIGPVPNEKADEVWKRFRAACDKFFDARKLNDKGRDEERAANLAKKEDLVARAEAIAASAGRPDLDWRSTADRLKSLQDEWKTVGFVPRDKGDEVWKRFRAACDKFFDARKQNLEKLDEERGGNLQKKLLLCEKVEALSALDDQDAAIEETKKLQAEWKSVGPVPKDRSDEVWSRFRKACDAVFAGPQISQEDLANATGVSGFVNRLPLEGIAAKLKGGDD